MRSKQYLIPRSPKLLAFYLAVLLVIAGGTTAYGVLSKTVSLSVEGKVEKVRTFSNDVSSLLESRGVEVGPEDRIVPAADSSLSGVDEVTVSYHKNVELAVDGVTRQVATFEPTARELFNELNVDVDDDAYVSVDPDAPLDRAGSSVVVSNPKPLKVVADGKKRKLTTNAATVSEVLSEVGVTLDADDRVTPATDMLVAPNTTMRVVRIEKVERTETVPVDFKTEVKLDDTLAKGDTKILVKGQRGTRREQIRAVYEDGKLKKRLVLKANRLSAPRTQVVARGTREAPTVPSGSVWDRLAQCESGGRWNINTGNGYYGGLQFSAATWRSVGGPGLPHQHSREVQIKYAKILQARSGWGQWGCASKVGIR